MRLYGKYIHDTADTFAFCLLKNHFHFLIRIIDPLENPDRVELDKGNLDIHNPNPVRVKNQDPSRQFSHLFNSYAQDINRAFNRTGGLFETPFKRKLITSDNYFTRLVYYIHANPQTYGFVDDFKTYPYSSYRIITGETNKNPDRVDSNKYNLQNNYQNPVRLDQVVNFLKVEEVINWFGSLNDFISFHKHYQDLSEIEKFVIED